MRALILSLVIWLLPLALLADQSARWVESEGLAYINNGADRDAARQRALGEALISAALAGGASLQGHSVLHNARLVSDVAVLRATGRVLRHDIIAAHVESGHWRVRVRALVGPATPQSCGGKRRLNIDATPPRIQINPNAGAWAQPVAQQLARDVMSTVARHPAVTLETVAPRPRRRVAATLDYTTLTRGEITKRPGNEQLELSIEVRGQGPRAQLTMTLAVTGAEGRVTRTTLTRTAAARADGLFALATGQRRPKAERELVAGLLRGVETFFDTLVCKPPETRIEARGSALTVGIGRRQGLTRTSLAFIDDPRSSFGLLEVVELTNTSARLRPLDPTRASQSFVGRRVYFVETGR
ncbi:MAG: flagellar assembly protein T N-terminal domain-containing protein [Rhodobacteraceae bacterium]|nr:flagellar assembly protein T N-terminal domain-containing protein [Paracoccaceae bacterium]